MKSFRIVLIFCACFLASGVWAQRQHHGHRRSRQSHPGRPPPNAPMDLEALDALGIQRPPPGRTIVLNKPDRDRYDAYIANKRNNAAGPQLAAADPGPGPGSSNDNGNPYNAAAAGVDANTLEKDKGEIMEELEKRAEEIIGDDGDADIVFANQAQSTSKHYYILGIVNFAVFNILFQDLAMRMMM